MNDFLNSLIASGSLPWYLTAAIAFVTFVYPILRKQYPKLPDVYGMLAGLWPSKTPAGPAPLVPLSPAPPVDPGDKFPLLSAALKLWFLIHNKPAPQEVADVPPEALKQIGDEWDAVAGLLSDAYEQRKRLLADAVGPPAAK